MHPRSVRPIHAARADLPPGLVPSRFRLQAGRRTAAGQSWTLITGSDRNRPSLTIGVCSEEDARRYLAGMEALRLEWTVYLGWCVDTLGAPALPAPDAPVRLVLPGVDAAGRLRIGGEDPRRIMAAGRDPERRAAVLAYLWAYGGMPGVVEKLTRGGTSADVDYGKVDPAHLTPSVAEGMRLRDYYAQVWAAERARRRPRTWTREEGVWTRHLLPGLGDVRLRELDTATFDRFMRGLQKADGGELGYHYLRNIRKAYQALLKEAELRGLRMQRHTYRRLDDAPQDVLGAFETLTPAEVEALCQAASSARVAALFAYAFYTGTRPAEATAVRWESIDWEARPLSPYGRVQIEGTKTRRARDSVPIPEALSRRLRAYHVASGSPCEGPVFAFRGKAIASFKTALAHAARGAGFPSSRRIFPNLFRHSYATWLLANGTPAADVAMLLRHTSPAMVRRVYDHAKVSDKVDIRRLLGAAGTMS